MIQPADACGSVAWRAERGSCGMEYTDVCCVACDRAVGKGRSSFECWVPLIKEKVADEVIEVHLSYVHPKCLE